MKQLRPFSDIEKNSSDFSPWPVRAGQSLPSRTRAHHNRILLGPRGTPIHRGPSGARGRKDRKRLRSHHSRGGQASCPMRSRRDDTAGPAWLRGSAAGVQPRRGPWQQRVAPQGTGHNAMPLGSLTNTQACADILRHPIERATEVPPRPSPYRSSPTRTWIPGSRPRGWATGS
jgi:hypothetical protein